MNLLRLREIWRIEGLDNKLLVAGCWSLVGTDNGYAHISEARCPPQRASALAGDPGCGAPGRIRAGSPSVLHPTLRKSAKDGAPELFTSHSSHKTRRMGHPLRCMGHPAKKQKQIPCGNDKQRRPRPEARAKARTSFLYRVRLRHG